MFTSIRTRLTLSHLAVIALAMGLLGFLSLSLLERYFLQAMEQSLVSQAQITAQALIPGAVARGPAAGPAPSFTPAALAPAFNALQQRQVSNLSLQTQNVDPPLSGNEAGLGESMPGAVEPMDLSYLADASLQLSTLLDTRIRLLDSSGVVLVDSQQKTEGADLHADLLVSRALDGQYATLVENSGRDPAMQLAMPVSVGDRLVAAIYLSQPLGDVTAVVHDLRTRWLLATAVAALMSGAAGLLLSRAIARPLGRLTAAAGAVARGDLDQQVPVSSQDELGHLSQAFNEMTARLCAARQMQTDFVANVSHELRTPLTAVKGMVETLRDGAVDDTKVRDRFLATVEDETDRLIRLVNDLLTLSRADSSALNLKRDAVNLVELVGRTIERTRTQAAARALLLETEVVSALSPVWVDPDRIEQVLVNLIDNAIRYSRPGGTVTVRLGPAPDTPRWAQVSVCDQGCGIPAGELPHVGERFYRTDRARSRSDGGSGLGIAIARALVEAHGGRLWLESQEGAGTVASFTLPIR